MVEKLKNFVAEKNDVDQLVELAAYAKGLGEMYQAVGVDRPAWLLESNRVVLETIKARKRDAMHAQLTAARARMETLKSQSERRNETQEEIRRLEAQLQA